MPGHVGLLRDERLDLAEDYGFLRVLTDSQCQVATQSVSAGSTVFISLVEMLFVRWPNFAMNT